ncbi:MAG TPA: DUF4097 family beta strand repeat-containing protein [Gemmatimonadaceae bacterium]|nr:DUF4097 family beta strand repeat-containing protein [Gemmatimonadaceae bacterium]
MTFVRFAGVAMMVAMATATLPRSAHAQRRRYSSGSSRVDTTLAIAKNGTVTIGARTGDVVVTGWSRDQVHVRGGSDEGDIRIQASGSQVDVNTSRSSDDTRIEVSVPYGVKVVASSLSGDVSVRGTRGAVEIHAQSGDVHIEDVATRLAVSSLSGDITASSIAGDVAVETVSGDVNIDNLRGDVDIGTVSGEIALHGATSRTVRAKSTSGDITYDGVIDNAGRYELTSHSGDIRLKVQRDPSAQVAVSTWSGSVDSDFQMTLNPGQHGIGSSNAKGFTFSLGGGAARIIADTFSGDIDIRSSGHGATVRRE